MNEQTFSRLLGGRIQSEANDLKRTPEALADEIGLPREHVRAIIEGTAGLEAARDMMRRMAEAYPIALADIWMEADDTDEGVRVMRAAESEASSRVFERVTAAGAFTPYYEYRDTVMSRTAPYKPEWILELRTVGDSDPENPDVAYNHGHLMHQITFFIGEVNFYWSIGGKKYCSEMNTGDCNYITPYVPHSFTSRNPDEPGLILAVTFGGQVRKALDEFSHIGIDAAAELAGDLRDTDNAYAVRLKRYQMAETLSDTDLVSRLGNQGIGENRAADLAGGALPSETERAALAVALNVRVSDLWVDAIAPGQEVVVTYGRDVAARPYPSAGNPDYLLKELARVRQMPYLKGFDVQVVSDQDTGEPMRHGLHQYAYNYGTEPVILQWSDGRCETLHTCDSAYVRPMTAHRFYRAPGADEGKLFVARIPGALTDSVMDEFAAFDTERRHRAAKEMTKWF